MPFLNLQLRLMDVIAKISNHRVEFYQILKNQTFVLYNISLIIYVRFFLIQLSKTRLLYCHNISLITCMRLFQVSDYIWRSRTFNGMKFSGVVLSTLGLLLVLVPDSCIGEVCTSCMKHIHTKPNIPPPERRGRRARRDIIRA